jgi:hypothetical protein
LRGDRDREKIWVSRGELERELEGGQASRIGARIGAKVEP